MLYNKAKALVSLKPGAEWVWGGEDFSGLKWLDSKIAKPTEAEIDAELTKLNNAEL